MTKEEETPPDSARERTQTPWNVNVYKELTQDQISEIIVFFDSKVNPEDKFARFSGTFSPDTLAAILKRKLPEANLVALARGQDGELVGIGEMYETIVPFKDPNTQNRERTTAYKMSLTPSSALHRRGIGRALSLSLIDQSQMDGVDTFLFVSDRLNIASQGFVRSMKTQLNPSRTIAIPDPDTIQYLVTFPPHTAQGRR